MVLSMLSEEVFKSRWAHLGMYGGAIIIILGQKSPAPRISLKYGLIKWSLLLVQTTDMKIEPSSL